MPHKILVSCYLLSLLFVYSFFEYENFFYNSDLTYQRQEYKVVVKLIDDEWRVVLADDDSQSDVTLRRGDRIRWDVEGSNVTFNFPEIGIFGLESRDVKSGNRLVISVKNNSPLGEFAYSVYVHDAETYARGQSPPRIIIRE